MENKTTLKSQKKRGLKLVKRHRERPVLLTLAVFLADLLDFRFRFFVWIIKSTFPLLMQIIIHFPQ